MKPIRTVKSSRKKEISGTVPAASPQKSETAPAPAAKAAAVISTPAGQKTSSTGTARPVTIEAKIDVGFGNTLYLRGEGQGLSWNRGVPLKNIDNSTWQWTGEANDRLKFK